MCYIVIVTLVHIVTFLLYLIFTSRIKKDGNLNKINNGFYYATMLISIISLIICIVYMVKDNTKEYFASYLALLLLYIFFTNFYSTIEYFDDYIKNLLVKFFVMLVIEIVLFVFTIILENIFPIKNIVINRVIIVFIMCSLYYTIYSFLLLSEKFDKELIKLGFDVTLMIYLCTYSIFYLVQNKNEDVIGKILVSISILNIFFDKADKIMRYFNYSIGKKI